MDTIVNVAAYRFTTLEDLEGLQARFREVCGALDLRGTILLSEEGVNVVAAGPRDDIDTLLRAVRALPGCADIEVKESFSSSAPFGEMFVKIKKEIIAFGVEGIDPRVRTSKRITAQELKAWLDEGRPVTLLDTRNEFEIEAGTFKGAISVGVDNFRDFPEAAAKLPDELKDTPVVTFCTGGIRCEKAAPFLEAAEFGDVYQLDGGILKYFEDVGGEHYEGSCFVFDERVALDAELKPASLEEPPRLM